MHYQNARAVLPPALLREVQRYAQGICLYIPREDAPQERNATHYQQELQARNRAIFTQYEAGASAVQLAQHYYLTPKSIYRIVARERKEREFAAMLEPMGDFFDKRVSFYDEHMKTEVDGADRYYEITAGLFPRQNGMRLLDLGCGTGLELEPLFQKMPDLTVTGYDLSREMTRVLLEKFPGKAITVHRKDYLQEEFGTACFDAALSVQSLHHFTGAQKIPLYRRIHQALVPGGFYVETDYMALTEAQEAAGFAEYHRLLAQMPDPKAYYHFDTPYTAQHQMEFLKVAGFDKVEQIWRQEGTVILRAWKNG